MRGTYPETGLKFPVNIKCSDDMTFLAVFNFLFLLFFFLLVITAWCAWFFSVRLSPSNESSATNTVNGSGGDEKPRPLHQIQTYRFVSKLRLFAFDLSALC